MAFAAKAIASEDPQPFFRIFSQRRTPAEYWLEALLREATQEYQAAAEVLDLLPDHSWGEERALRLLAVARNWKQAKELDRCWQPLAEAIRSADALRTLSACDKLLSQLRKQTSIPSKRRCRIALLGSITWNFAAPALRALCFAWGIDAELYIGQFGQYHQEILDPQSGLAAFRPEIVLISVDWRALKLPVEAADDFVAENKIAEMRPLWQHCRESLSAIVIQHNFEVPEADPLGRLSMTVPGGRARVLRQANLLLAAEPGVAVLDLDQIASLHGKVRWNDEVLWQAAKQYPSSEAIPLLMRHQTALLRAALGLTSKCLALDLDNTLWGGVIGEDGLTGIRLGGSPEGESFVAFQRYVQALQRRGVILAVCSKNNEEDARLPFLQHPEMVLKLDDIACFRANWKTKDENLRDIAATLNIGLDSVVFFDDNPLERGLIRKLLPELEVPEVPLEPAQYVNTLHRSLVFEEWSLTEDDRKRGEAYRLNAQRQQEQKAAGNVDSYLAELQMKIGLRAFDEANLARVVQLINKTNQFNLTTQRTTTAECQSWMARPDCYTQFMRLQDKFGDNGITGVLVAFQEEEIFRIHTWLISCRVLGRRVEDAMLHACLREAQTRGCTIVQGDYFPTPKNGQVKELYGKWGFHLANEDADGNRRFTFSLANGIFSLPEWLQVDDQSMEDNHDGSDAATA